MTLLENDKYLCLVEKQESHGILYLEKQIKGYVLFMSENIIRRITLYVLFISENITGRITLYFCVWIHLDNILCQRYFFWHEVCYVKSL